MLRRKRAVITGGGGGFGQALCVWLAREGVDVDFSARRVEDIETTCALIAAEGGCGKRVSLRFSPAGIRFSVLFAGLTCRQANRYFTTECCSVAVRDYRRTIERRNRQYRQFRPDRFNPAHPGAAFRIATFRRRRHHCDCIRMRYSELYRFHCPSRFFCQQTWNERLYHQTVKTIVPGKYKGDRLVSTRF